MKNRIISLLLIFALSGASLYSQEDIVVPYKPDEFPEWTMDLRRAEIITLGSFPLAFMFTALVYDVSMSAVTGFDPSIPFGSSRSQDDIINLLLISAGVSVAIGLTDFIIQQVKKSKIKKEKQELDEQRKNNSDSSRLPEDES